ncbi:MAG: outer membrane lipoprotein carrier protein LolA [Bacteroidales bacterium]|nr:outer membrane lipoprotein carrier protein LolA [Bacteroidales bacterium]
MKQVSIIILFLVLRNSIAISQEINGSPVKEPGKIMEQVTQYSQRTSSITADFTQVKEMSFMEEKIISTGRFYFQKEKQLRWEYSEPFSYAIIISGETIRIMDEGRKKDFDAASNRMFLEISNVMTGMVNGTLLNSDQFITSWYETPGYFRAELIPGGAMMKDYLSRIELKLNKKDYSVDELKMFEKSGDYTLVTFSNKKLNEAIPSEIFRLD